MPDKKKLLWLGAGACIVIVFLVPVFSGEYFHYAKELLQTYPYLAPLTIIMVRFLGIVLAPLPGAPAAFASLAFLPWYEAWAYNLIGVELGSVCAFLIARKWRESAAARFAPLQELHAWQAKISERGQLWRFMGMRFVSAIVVDFLSYAAGLSTISFKNFLLGSIFVDALISAVFFYLGGAAFMYGMYVFIAFAALFFVFFLAAKYREKIRNKQ